MHHRPTASAALALPIAKRAVPLDENAFVDWLIDANPGDKVAYYRGHLGYDRMPSANVLDRQSRAVLHAVATRVMVAASQGLVLPVQKRIGPEDYLYVVVKALPGRVSGQRGCFPPLPAPFAIDKGDANSVKPASMALAA